MDVIVWIIAMLAALTIATIFLIWRVNELCNRLDQRLRIMMGRDDKRVWYEIDLDGGEEDEDED